MRLVWSWSSRSCRAAERPPALRVPEPHEAGVAAGRVPVVTFLGRYPVIDIDAGGGVAGMIAAAERLMALARPDTKVIPGHGPLSTPAEIKTFRDMLAGVRDAIQALVAAGKTLEEAQAAKPTAPWDETWARDAPSGRAFHERRVQGPVTEEVTAAGAGESSARKMTAN